MIRNTDDTILVADIIERIDDLENDRFITEGEKEELEELKVLEEQGSFGGDWDEDGILINEYYFTEYTREYAIACSSEDLQDAWPYTCIDWEAAADDLQNDYSIINFDGVDYYIRLF